MTFDSTGGARRPSLFWLTTVSGAALVYIAWHLLGTMGTGLVSRLIDLGMLEGFCVATILAMARASLRSDCPPRMRLALRWILSGFAFQALAGVDLVVEKVILARAHSFLALTGILFSCAYAATIVGLATLPRATRRRHERLRALVNGAVFVAAAAVPYLVFSHKTSLQSLRGEPAIEGLALPLLSFAGLLTVTWAMETRLVFPSRGAFRPLIIGIGLFWIGDILLFIDRDTGLIPGGTLNWINSLNAIAFCLCLFGAWRTGTDPLDTAETGPLVEFSPLPLITLVLEAGFLVALVTSAKPDPEVLSHLLGGLSVFLVVLLARETFVIRDSIRLLESEAHREKAALEEQLGRARKMEAVGRLAGGVAHDFNNLLTVILANSELALLTLDAKNPARREVGEILRAASRGATLTTRLLAFTRTENLKPRAVSAAGLLEEAGPMVERALGGRARLETRIEPGTAGVKINPDDFTQALINLAANARDAMPDGGTLAIRLFPATLTKPLASSYLEAIPGRYAVVSVSDTGAGMDEETRVRAFEPFFTTKDRSSGTGLGLAGVYGTVKSAGGGITLRSARGQGTSIELWLPEVPLEDLAPPAQPKAAPASGSQTILLVEDEGALREAAQRILESAGYKVFSASDAESAVTFTEEHAGPIDLFLVDVVMPGLSGPQLVERLRKRGRPMRVLFMSGYTGNQLAVNEPVPDGVRLLKKPFNSEQLVTRVREVFADAQ